MTLEEVKTYFYDSKGRFLTKKFLKDKSKFKDFLCQNVFFNTIEELTYRLKFNDFSEHKCLICRKTYRFYYFKGTF